MTNNTSIPGLSQASGTPLLFLSSLPSLLNLILLRPIKFLCLRAIPSVVFYVYLTLRCTLYYTVIMLRWLLIPVLYPLEVLLWRPCMAVMLIIYQVRSDLRTVEGSTAQERELTRPWFTHSGATYSTSSPQLSS